MSTFIKTLSAIVPLLLIFISVQGQDLKHLYQIAHYRLVNSTQDLEGNLDSMELDNAPYDGTSGVYSNGIYPGTDPKTGSYIRTPDVESLYDPEFAILLVFKLDQLDGETRPVVVLGESARYLGLEVRYDNKFTMLFNNNQHIVIDGITAAPTWYEVAILHNQSTQTTEFYLSGDLVGTLNGALNREENDGRISNINPSTAQAFKGHWQNLFIYGSEEITALKESLKENDNLAVFPNPASTQIYFHDVDLRAAQWTIRDMNGMPIRSGDINDIKGGLDIRGFIPGSYMLQLRDAAGKPVAKKRFIKV